MWQKMPEHGNLQACAPEVQGAHTSDDETEGKRTSRGVNDTRIGTLKKREWFVAGVRDSMSYRRVYGSVLRNPFK